MEHKILQSVVDITKQRDLDSMESSLLSTLAELLPIVDISIVKSLEDNNITCAEEVISLSINPAKKDPYIWTADSKIILTDEYFNQCLASSTITTHHDENGLYRYFFPVCEDSHTIGCLYISSLEDLSEHINLIEGFAKVYENYMVIFNKSERDKLTGLFNRRTFDNKLSRLFKLQHCQSQQNIANPEAPTRRREDENSSVWLVIADIDFFKKINDNYGHVYGDEVILTISQIMKSCFRTSDLLFRVGGEEFVILLGSAPKDVAEALIQRFLKTVKEHVFSEIGTVTISAGYTKISDKDYPPAILECADKALYYAKEHGRDCSYYYEDLVEQGKITLPKKAGSVNLF